MGRVEAETRALDGSAVEGAEWTPNYSRTVGGRGVIKGWDGPAISLFVSRPRTARVV